VGWWWIVRRARSRQAQLDALKDATRLGKLVSGGRLLVIRAIDDEASLALALGAILNYLTARSITYVYYLWVVLSSILGSSYWVPWIPYWGYPAALAPVLLAVFIASTIALAAALMGSRLVLSRELAVSPMECQVNTHSAPDAVDLSKIVTLVSQNYVKSLRHGIYEHENCAKVISDWYARSIVPSA